ncbi:Retrotrans gag domain-containing protein [Abeliophyllum distichum]|uniref:Retrotrans gag domain-containing protein n=1 Tax=Abeliophyllum distichum TaxID=126358 RepID=A0ABD1U1Q0_9LAMI
MDLNASHITEVVDHKKSTKQRLDAIDRQSTRLCVAVETFEEKEEMEAMRLQLRILQRVVGNGQAPAQEYAPRLKIPEPCTYGGARDVKKVENFLFTWNNTFSLLILKTEQEE